MITFTSVFVILFFIFVLQGIWLFITEHAGKDLGILTILKFLSFYAPTIIPMVLPLSVLLASIMTFGSFAENYEFAAMKSSGISLQRAMKMLSIAILFLSFISFFFANNLIPSAQYNFLNLRKNILQQTPAMAIAEGQFNALGNFNIKVAKKYGPEGNNLEDVIIHIKGSNSNAGNKVIKAKKGLLSSNENTNYLNLTLFDGYYYENVIPKKYTERKKHPFAKSSFEKYIINIDLAALNPTNSNTDDLTSEKMLTSAELSYAVDTLTQIYDNEIVSFSENIIVRTNSILKKDYSKAKDSIAKDKKSKNDLLSYFKITDQQKILEIAKNNLSTIKFSISDTVFNLKYKKKVINSHWIAIHDKFVIAYSCLLMFFIGAPLGAIIKKGGIGLPIVFAVGIFISFYFINTFGRKIAEEDTIPPFLGMWMASIIMTPFAVLLTYRATNDIAVNVNLDWLIDPIKALFSKFNKNKNE